MDLAKDGHIFCRVTEIESTAEKIFSKLDKENNFKNSTKEELSHKLSDLFFEVNQLHPFREGNGRTQRQFLSNLAKINGYELDFKNISSDEMIKISVNKDKKSMIEKINENLKTISRKKELKKNKEKDLER